MVKYVTFLQIFFAFYQSLSFPLFISFSDAFFLCLSTLALLDVQFVLGTFLKSVCRVEFLDLARKIRKHHGW